MRSCSLSQATSSLTDCSNLVGVRIWWKLQHLEPEGYYNILFESHKVNMISGYTEIIFDFSMCVLVCESHHTTFYPRQQSQQGSRFSIQSRRETRWLLTRMLDHHNHSSIQKLLRDDYAPQRLSCASPGVTDHVCVAELNVKCIAWMDPGVHACHYIFRVEGVVSISMARR